MSLRDAGAGTFYSAMSNVDMEFEDGNPYAVALRTHYAQHSFISHVDLRINNGLAGMFDVGNEMEDVKFFGGEYGIYTTKPSPGWQFMITDVYFEGQRKAAIKTQEAGLTIVRLQAKHVPSVFEINRNYIEKLFMEDCRFEDVQQQAILVCLPDIHALTALISFFYQAQDHPFFVLYKIKTGHMPTGGWPVFISYKIR